MRLSSLLVPGRTNLGQNSSWNKPQSGNLQYSEVHVFAIIVALTFFVASLIGRLGMNDPVNLLPLALSISLILLPPAIQRFWKIDIAILQAITIAFFFVCGWLSLLFDVNLKYLVFATAITGLICLFMSFRTTRTSLYLVLLFVCVSLALLSSVWVQDYMNPLSPEAFSVGLRFGHVDTLYLSAITSNIKNYFVASLGLFGLEPIKYHVGSNYLFASFSQLCNVTVLKFYNIGFPIIFVPLFCQTFFYAAYSQRRPSWHPYVVVSSILVFFLAFSGIVPREVGTRYLHPAALNHHFVSQSYCVSLIYLFLAIRIYAPFIRHDYLHPNPRVNTTLILFIPVFFFLIGITKVSTGIVALCVFIYLIVRRGLVFQKWIFISFLASCIVTYWVFTRTIESNVVNFSIDFGSYYKTYLKGNIFTYVLLHFLLLIALTILLFILIGNSRTGIYTNTVSDRHLEFKVVIDRRGILGRWISGRFIMIELVVISAVVGVIPGLLIHIDGSSAYYFSDIQYWLSAIALAGLMPYVVRRYQAKDRLWKTLMFFMSLAVLSAAGLGAFYFVKKNIQIKTALAYGKEETFKRRVTVESAATVLKELSTGLTSSSMYRSFVDNANIPMLDSLAKLPSRLKRKSVIYCEDLKSLNSFLTCGESIFYLTAVGEIAIINGTKDMTDCAAIGAYGMHDYKEYPAQVDKAQAIDFAKGMGFENLILINLQNNSCTLMRINSK